MKLTPLLIPAILAAGLGGWADTLWAPSFEGYLSASSAVAVGDIVYVQIDGATSLSFQAAASDSKSQTLEFSGGEFGSLFSFLPQARSGAELSSSGRQQYALESRFAARVTQLDASRKARIEGTRSVALGGKQESLALSGWLDPADLVSSREVRFSQLADARLSFRTLLEPAAPTLSSRDIQQIVAALTDPAPAAAEYALTDARKRELFLRYVNRLIDFLFRP